MKTVAAVAAVLALASPLAAFAQTPGAHEVTKTVVTHEQTRSGPVVTRTTTVRPISHRPVFHRTVFHRVVHHRYVRNHHPIVRKVVVSQGYGHGVVKTTTTVVRR